MDKQPKRKEGNFINLKAPGPTSAVGIQDIALGCWSTFGAHERTDVAKKIAEQPRLNPVDPKTLKSGGELS
jgi:hypothetical protein